MFENTITVSEKNPLVSVLMTAYNRADYISEAIESVIGSTYTNWELIVVDDCSTDETVTIARSFASRDPRIAVYVNEQNQGDYPNRNKAAGYAKGTFVKYLDSDDRLLEWGLAYCVQAMLENPTAGWATYCPHLNGTEEVLLCSSEQVIRDHFFKKPHLSIGPTGTMFRRAFFNELGFFDTRFGVASDGYMNIRMAMNSPVVLLPRLFVFYRIHENQEKNNASGYLVNNFLHLRELFDSGQLPLTRQETAFLRRKLDKRHAVNLIRYLFRERNFRVLRKIMRTTSFSPLNIVSSLFK